MSFMSDPKKEEKLCTKIFQRPCWKRKEDKKTNVKTQKELMKMKRKMRGMKNLR